MLGCAEAHDLLLNIHEIGRRGSECSFPIFLFVDTPEILGIDEDVLFRLMSHLHQSVLNVEGTPEGQIIMTTGFDEYPNSLRVNVIFNLTLEHRLLERLNSHTQ